MIRHKVRSIFMISVSSSPSVCRRWFIPDFFPVLLAPMLLAPLLLALALFAPVAANAQNAGGNQGSGSQDVLTFKKAPPLPRRNRLRGVEQRAAVISAQQQQLQQKQLELKKRREEFARRRSELRREQIEMRRLQREMRRQRRNVRRMKRKLRRQQLFAQRKKKLAEKRRSEKQSTEKQPPENHSSKIQRAITVKIRPVRPSEKPKAAVETPKTRQKSRPEQAPRQGPIGKQIAQSDTPPPPSRKPHRHPSKMATPAWTPEFIKKAKAECVALLANMEIKALPLPPIHKGECGSPAPVLLTHISRKDSIQIKPGATLSCRMVAGLSRWLVEDVQPLAKKMLGSPVAKLSNISSYVCRRRYGASNTRISEHAYANALDVATFILKNGKQVSVLRDWNNEDGEKGAFLRALHRTACARFGTVLGPEANAAHKNHFHLDMKPRRHSNYCR